ncbi:MFS transporter [Aliiglaciecola litoralis]|uniref:MFS transporter n=1 Tax=Aliiglaciecola litoralis TaxID=582857 RepID=A0ABN1LDG1_9ALTE
MHTKVSKRNYWLLSGALLTFFLTWSFCFSIFSIWLEQFVGLNGEERGIVFGLSAFCALFVLPIYGYLQDKLGLKKHILYFIAGLLILVGPFAIYLYSPLLKTNVWLGAALGGVYFGMAFSAGVGVIESYVDRVGRMTGFEFGRARMWGSIGWAIAAFFTGRIFNINPELNFWLASLSGLLFLTCVAFVVPAASHKEEERFDKESAALNISDALHLFKNNKFLAMAVYVIGVATVYGVYDQQFSTYFASVFPTKEEGNAMYGYLNSLQVLLEALGMFLAPFLVNRIGAKNGLILAGAIMALRIVGSGYADDNYTISLMKLLHAVELPIMLVAIFKYISATFEAHLSATIYLVGFVFMAQIGAAALSIGVGMMYDELGFQLSYKILGAVVGFFVLVSWLVLTNDKTQNKKIQNSN